MDADGALCGLWVDPEGPVHTTMAGPDGERSNAQSALKPFAWLGETGAGLPAPAEITLERLRGDAPFRYLAQGQSLPVFNEFVRTAKEAGGVDLIRPLESQFLLQNRLRLFRELGFTRLRRCQLDIETYSEDGSFSRATRTGDRVLAIGLSCGGQSRLLILEKLDDPSEKRLLVEFNEALAQIDPDVIEGHNLFQFDLDYLKQRCRRHKVACLWGRYGQEASFRNSRLKVAERWIDFTRCDLPGRSVVDTYFLVQIHDITAREMTSYGLKSAAVYFGITPEDGEGRTYLEGHCIAAAFTEDRARFLAYLEDDLRETRGLADRLLPTYFEQTRVFPILLQDATLRGTTSKIDLLFQEEYYHARQSCPVPPEIQPFAGGYTRSFQEGVFRNVLHFDVASLYPSLLLSIGRNPKTDMLGVFIPLLSTLREYRLKYKQLARTGPTQEERSEANARQANFKILINSFYGYLGFSGARFGDGELAAEVTRRGRELLQQLIDEFSGQGCELLEADTDGLYVSSEKHFGDPSVLLALVAKILPGGIELECDGRYPVMFCYKSKNYALYDGKRVILRGSALRSRGTEPFLKKLTDSLIGFLLGVSTQSPIELLEHYRANLRDRRVPVDELAKTEGLGQNPDAYERLMAAVGKPRRASAEAALQMNPKPRMGDRVTYYITPPEKGRTNDWQRARPLSLYDPAAFPYDPDYYAEKLDDWLVRYGSLLGIRPAPAPQGELF